MAEAQLQEGRPIRPRSVTLVMWGVFLLALVNAWRAVGIYRQSDLWIDLELSLDPRLGLLTALGWTVVFLVLVVAIWRAYAIARLAAPALLLAYATYQLGTEYAFVQSPDFDRGWPLSAGLYALAILYTTWALNQAAGRRYFEKS